MEKHLKKIQDEEWRFIPESNDRYMVSNYGRVKSFMYNKTEGQIMRPCKMGNFMALKISVNHVMVNWYIHKLVATVFIPKESDELTHVIHVDLNYKNNQVSNLKWVTKDQVFQNVRTRNKLSGKRRKPVNTKLKESDVALLKSMIVRGVTQVEIAKLFCISEMQVTRIKRGDNWGHVKPSKEI
ncbi:MAG: NUMOD4 domain-containing protein [Prolixibacteraceae bacterium]